MGLGWIGLTAGALAFAHCLGMCGGFALHLAHGSSRLATLGRLLLWGVGKTSSYLFLGAVAGFVGEAAAARISLSWLQTALAYGIGALMVLMGLTLLGMVPDRAASPGLRQAEGLVVSALRPLLGRPNAGGALVLGMVSGFLPCPVVWALLALCLHGGSVAGGMILMGCLSLGSLWSLMMLGMTGQWLHARWRRWSAPLGATVLVLLGLVTIARATPALHLHPGHPAAVSGTAPGTSCAAHLPSPATLGPGPAGPPPFDGPPPVAGGAARGTE